MDGKLSLKLLTPVRPAILREMDGVNLTAAEGEVGILPGHAAFLAALVPGPAMLRDAESTERWLLGSGVVEIHDDVLTVLVQAAERSDEIDVERAKRRLAELEATVRDHDMSEADLARTEASIQKQKLRIALAGTT